MNRREAQPGSCRAKWLSNHYKGNPFPPCWGRPDIVIADPKATKALSAEKLKGMGMVGVYLNLDYKEPEEVPESVPEEAADPEPEVMEDPVGSVWHWPLGPSPVSDTNVVLPDEPGQFATVRKHDIHTGVDLYCEIGTVVNAAEDGVVVGIEQFTGMDAGTPWWRDTHAVLIEGESGVIVYGEIMPFPLEIGQKVLGGQPIGTVEPVLKEYKGRPMVMLHLELMKKGQRTTIVWDHGMDKPDFLLDPTPHLIKSGEAHLGHEIPTFSLSQYDGKAYRA